MASNLVLEMNPEQWSGHYQHLLNKKTDKGETEMDHTGRVCWNFKGRVNRAGYGVMDVIIPGVGKTVRTAQRMSYLVFNIKTWQLASDMEASHRCGNKLCVRPSHIVAETHEENKSRQICHGCGICMGHGLSPECIFPLQAT